MASPSKGDFDRDEADKDDIYLTHIGKSINENISLIKLFKKTQR